MFTVQLFAFGHLSLLLGVGSLRSEENMPSERLHSTCIRCSFCWVTTSEFQAKLKIVVNGKDGQTRVCSTRRNRERMENLKDWA